MYRIVRKKRSSRPSSCMRSRRRWWQRRPSPASSSSCASMKTANASPSRSMTTTARRAPSPSSCRPSARPPRSSATKQQGEFIQDFVGPLGRPTETEGKKKVCVVGGGVGCAIAYPVLKKFHDCGAEVHAVVGFKNKDVVILEDKFKSASDVMKLVTDDGSYGEKGSCYRCAQAAHRGGQPVRRDLRHRPRHHDEVRLQDDRSLTASPPPFP